MNARVYFVELLDLYCFCKSLRNLFNVSSGRLIVMEIIYIYIYI